MEADINNGAFHVIMESADFNINLGESAKIDVGQAVDYIKTGRAEIEEAVQSGTVAFNNNALSKTSDFNDNYTAKKSIIDTQVQLAEDWATKTDDKVDGEEYSAKYYAEQTAVLLSSKQDTIPAGTTGNVVTYSGTAGVVGSTALASVATSGSYDDLSNKPTIPAAQVQSDWNQTTTTEVDYIKNKPTIPTVNNATLTIQKNGTDVQTFTANASMDVTANIIVPTQASDIEAQATLVSGTNIKTINNNSILGSGNLDINGLPSQTGQSGKFLTTDGTDASWAIPSIPWGTSTSNVSSTRPAVIVEIYINGSSWYRVYSDGWCEQGGYVTGGASWGAVSVSLLKTMANTDYQVKKNWVCHSAMLYASYDATAAVYNKSNMTVSSFDTYNGTWDGFYWQASGYIS